MQRIIAFFRSLKLAAGVISFLILLYFLGLVTPQKWMFDTRELYEAWVAGSVLHRVLHVLGITDVYASPITIFLLCLFFINLVVVMLYRVNPILKRAHIGGGPPEVHFAALKGSPSALSLSTGKSYEETVGALRKAARHRGYAFFAGVESGTFLALKNRFSPLGFLLFHVSFILCLVGGLLISYTRFSGNIGLAEGQSFDGDMRQFHRIAREPKFFKALPALALAVEEVQPVYEKGVPSRLEAMLLVSDGKVMRREMINVNKPIERGPYTILVENIGVSPLFVVTGRSGRIVDSAYVSLNVLNGKTDSFRLEPLPGYLFTVQFYPDHRTEDGREFTASKDLKNPVFHLLIEREGNRMYEGTVKPGEFVAFDQYRMSVEDIRYWLDLAIIREYGVTPLVAGFVLASIGLVMRLVFYQKRISVAVDDTPAGRVVYLDGRSEYYAHSFQEEKEDFMKDIDFRLKHGRKRKQ